MHSVGCRSPPGNRWWSKSQHNCQMRPAEIWFGGFWKRYAADRDVYKVFLCNIVSNEEELNLTHLSLQAPQHWRWWQKKQHQRVINLILCLTLVHYNLSGMELQLLWLQWAPKCLCMVRGQNQAYSRLFSLAVTPSWMQDSKLKQLMISCSTHTCAQNILKGWWVQEYVNCSCAQMHAWTR